MGSRVVVTVKLADNKQLILTAEVQSVSGLLAQSDRRLNFGLGANVKSATAEVTWCGQQKESFELLLNQYNLRKQAL